MKRMRCEEGAAVETKALYSYYETVVLDESKEDRFKVRQTSHKLGEWEKDKVITFVARRSELLGLTPAIFPITRWDLSNAPNCGPVSIPGVMSSMSPAVLAATEYEGIYYGFSTKSTLTKFVDLQQVDERKYRKTLSGEIVPLAIRVNASYLAVLEKDAEGSTAITVHKKDPYPIYSESARTISESTEYQITAFTLIDDHKIAISDRNNKITIWDIETAQLLHTIQKAHHNAITVLKYESNTLISGSEDGDVNFWHLGEDTRLIRKFHFDGKVLNFELVDGVDGGLFVHTTCKGGYQHVFVMNVKKTEEVWNLSLRNIREIFVVTNKLFVAYETQDKFKLTCFPFYRPESVDALCE